MYYIITDNKEIYDFAKKKGAEVLSTKKPIIIKDSDKDKNSRILSFDDKKGELDTIDNFFNRVPEINKNTLGYKCIKYILKNKIKITIDTRYAVYEILAKEFNTSASAIVAGITCLFKKIYEDSSNHSDFEEIFDEIKKNPKARYRGEYAAEFIRLLSEKYIDKISLQKERKFSSSRIEEFFGKFYYVNKKTLGYECVKYILKNGIECKGDYEKTLYPVLSYKFNVKSRIIKQSLTHFFNNCRYNARFGMPEDFMMFYEKHKEIDVNKSIEERNFTFLSLCRNYLKKIY